MKTKTKVSKTSKAGAKRKIKGTSFYFVKSFTSQAAASKAATKIRMTGYKARVKQGKGKLAGAYNLYSTQPSRASAYSFFHY